MTFLPPDYEIPSDNANYLKLGQGDTRIRILTKPILGYMTWIDNNPIRVRTKAECPTPTDPKQKIKHFWALVVYNVDMNKIQIWEVTQSSIQSPIANLAQNPDWGDPTQYGITITKKGDGLDTEYFVSPQPPRPIPEDVNELYRSMTINLDALYEGADPFEPASRRSNANEHHGHMDQGY